MEDFLLFASQHGGPGLLLFCLAAATILPISSEAALVGAMGLGMDPFEALVWASVGNCLGVVLNYGVGALFSGAVLKKLSASRSGQKGIEWVERYGLHCLWLSWTPFLGDPITYAAGAFRISLFLFILLTFSLRIARYLVFVLFFV